MAKRVRDMDVFGGLAPQPKQHNTVTQEDYTTNIHNTHTQWVTAPAKGETRSKRVQLVFKPSLLEAVDAEAARCGVSRNELVHQVLERYLRGDGT